MTEISDQPSTAVMLGETDNLKLIRGINHGVEERLHHAGILTYAELAASSPQELSVILKGMVGFSVKRIQSLDWIGQARQLALIKEQESQRYAGFTLELLLDPNDDVRRTKIKHVQTQSNESWAGWDGERLLAFIMGQAGIRQESRAAGIDAVQERRTPDVAGKDARLVSNFDLGGDLHLSDVRLNVEGLQEGSRLLPSNEALSAHLVLDLTEASGLREWQIPYSATVFARKLGHGGTQEIGKAEGAVELQNQVVIDVPCHALSEGIYHIEATIVLASAANSAARNPFLAGFAESELIQVV